jgi:hypothetical protein
VEIFIAAPIKYSRGLKIQVRISTQSCRAKSGLQRSPEISGRDQAFNPEGHLQAFATGCFGLARHDVQQQHVTRCMLWNEIVDPK